MTEPYPAAQALLAVLSEAQRSEIEERIAQGKTDDALDTLHLAARNSDPRTRTEALVVLATRAGTVLICPKCGEGPSDVRDDHLFLPLCEGCSATHMTWPCPDCGQHVDGPREAEGTPCIMCENMRLWTALTQDERDEIDRAVAELSSLRAIKRIKELIRCDGLQPALGIYNVRYQNRRNSSGSIPRNSS